MFARTKRLTLRPGWPEDAPALAAAIAHESVVMKLARAPWPYTVSDAEQFLIRPMAHRELSLLIFSHEHVYPALIGGIGIHPQERGHEIGYWLTPSAWGRGYATEAGRAVIDIARHAMGLKRLGSSHFLDNPASGRVLRKLGFRESGRDTRACVARGHDVACAVFERDLDEEDRPAPLMIAA